MSKAKNRSGPLSKGDKSFIQSNVDNMTSDDIAHHLERNPNTIQSYIENNRMGKQFHVGATSDINHSNIYDQLKKKPFFKHLPEQFTRSEIKYFCDYWILTVIDFGSNILSYEELELKEWLTFEILKSRALKDNRLNILNKEDIKEQLNQEFKVDRDKRDKDRIRYLQSELELVGEDIKKHNKEFADIAHKADAIKKGLVKNRDQRTKDMDMSDLNFANYLKMCQSYDIKKRVGEEMELFRLCEQKKRKKLYEYHEYADGEVDQPILSASSIEEIKNV